MAWLPMYLLRQDVALLNEMLNQEEEIAFLIALGSKSWIAVKEYTIVKDLEIQKFKGDNGFPSPDYVEYLLWHIPSGPLPLLQADTDSEKWRFTKEERQDNLIDNPWQGWSELRTGANARIPYFGAGHPGVIHLKVELCQAPKIAMSAFGWIGNHYRMIGNGAEQSTEAFWKKLRRTLKKVATLIPRANDKGGKPEIYTFPEAYQAIQNGYPCARNP